MAKKAEKAPSNPKVSAQAFQRMAVAQELCNVIINEAMRHAALIDDQNALTHGINSQTMEWTPIPPKE